MLENVAFLKSVPDIRKQLDFCKIMRLYSVALDDTVVMKQGDEGDAMYIILVGLFKVSVNGNMVAYLSQGGHFGDKALENNAPRNASITSAEPVSSEGPDFLACQTCRGILQHLTLLYAMPPVLLPLFFSAANCFGSIAPISRR